MATPVSSNKYDLLLLFYRPYEPSHLPKGPTKVLFDIPKNYYTAKYEYLAERPDLLAAVVKGVESVVKVNPVDLPDLEDILALPRNVPFSTFIPLHRSLANKLVDIFLDAKDTDKLLSIGIYARDRVNPQLFIYALSVALLHRPDTKSLKLPSLIHSFPQHLISDNYIAETRQEYSTVADEFRDTINIPLNYSATDLDVEHRVAYFREDMGICLHHWQWHIVYPHHTKEKIARKDRRGELFYYMHQQMLARYNFERLSNMLHRVRRFIDWDSPMEEAYFPKLQSTVGSGTWPGRVNNLKWQNIHRDGMDTDVADMRKWRDRINHAIDSRAVICRDGTIKPLTDDNGIDVLGDIIESSMFSPNLSYYGDLHNMGHVLIAGVHDPEHSHLENFGVMGYNQTAVRDPMFYRWHAYINDLFQTFKATTAVYKDSQLGYDKVAITEAEIQINKKPTSTLQTFWKLATVDISGGIDITPHKQICISFTHLDHTPFSYNIKVQNDHGENVKGTCRIFLAPKYDEKNALWTFEKQREMFIEMDKFTVSLIPGPNTITRQSSESSVIIPCDQVFRPIEIPPQDADIPPASTSSRLPGFCGCGWPEYMLVPKGTPGGMQCQLFVMISNYDGDKVPGLETPESTNGDLKYCSSEAPSYCGSRDKFFPDHRPMGYPFDRPYFTDGSCTIHDFVKPFSNMKVNEIQIQFLSDKPSSDGTCNLKPKNCKPVKT